MIHVIRAFTDNDDQQFVTTDDELCKELEKLCENNDMPYHRSSIRRMDDESCERVFRAFATHKTRFKEMQE